LCVLKFEWCHMLPNHCFNRMLQKHFHCWRIFNTAGG
jgi:hypothetical protein